MESPLQRGGPRSYSSLEVGLDEPVDVWTGRAAPSPASGGTHRGSVPRCVSWSPRPEDHKGCTAREDSST